MEALEPPVMKLRGIKRSTLTPFILLLCSRHHKKEISQLSRTRTRARAHAHTHTHTQWRETRLLHRPEDRKFKKLRKLPRLRSECPDDVRYGRTDFRLIKRTTHSNGLLLPISILLSFLTEPSRFKRSPHRVSVSPFQLLNHTVASSQFVVI